MNFDDELNEEKMDFFVFELQLFEQVACCLTSCNFLTDDSQSQLKNADFFSTYSNKLQYGSPFV